MKKYLKLIKSEESYNTWKNSDEAGYPHVVVYETNHPEITSGEGIIFEKSTEKTFSPITLIVGNITDDNLYLYDYLSKKCSNSTYTITEEIYFKVWHTMSEQYVIIDLRGYTCYFSDPFVNFNLQNYVIDGEYIEMAHLHESGNLYVVFGPLP